MHLIGRRIERQSIELMLGEARAGRSGALLVGGEAGIGKTALLEYAGDAALALQFRVERVIGMESERQFAFAALYQLCESLLPHAAALTEPQRDALGIVFGRQAGSAPDQFLVGLAALNLVAESAEKQALLFLIDDAQWLDPASAQIIAFVARRVSAERVAFLIGMRDTDGRDSFSGIPRLGVTGLSDADADALLGAVLRTPIDRTVRERVVAEARGNPLALLELPRNAQPLHLASGFEPPQVSNVPHRIEETYRRRSAMLPTATQQLLLVAAAEPTGDASLLWKAATYLGIDPEAAVAAESADLLAIDTRVRFRHPLVRSAIYGAAGAPERRRAHDALARATDARLEPDRRIWHRGQAVVGTDDEVAAQLERSAYHALARGGMAAAGAFMQRSAELSSHPAERSRRAIVGAQAKHEAGAPEEALRLLTLAAGDATDPLQNARITLMRAMIALYVARGDQAPVKLLAAARELAPLDPEMSRETYLLALNASTIAGGPRPAIETRDIAAAARTAPAAPDPPRPLDLLLDGLVTTYTADYARGAAELHAALLAFREPGTEPVRQGGSGSERWLWLASRTAVALYDSELMHDLSARNVDQARQAEALATLHPALVAQSAALVLSGDLISAARLDAESDEIAYATGAAPLHFAKHFLAGWGGKVGEMEQLLETAIHGSDPGNGAEVAGAHHGMAVLRNGTRDYRGALDAALRACGSDELAVNSLTLPELIEAAHRAGEPRRASAAWDLLLPRAQASGTNWALGLAACARAILTDGQKARIHYEEAIERLAAARMSGYLGRTHLLYGEWLRRDGHRQLARKQLGIAHEILTDVGATGFAARAAHELRATGARISARDTRQTPLLTDHELHIARLVATGATSREVAGQLFLSPRTIDAHLRNIYRKLDITSRRELRKTRLP